MKLRKPKKHKVIAIIILILYCVGLTAWLQHIAPGISDINLMATFWITLTGVTLYWGFWLNWK
jgi:hypothetical protein